MDLTPTIILYFIHCQMCYRGGNIYIYKISTHSLLFYSSKPSFCPHHSRKIVCSKVSDLLTFLYFFIFSTVFDFSGYFLWKYLSSFSKHGTAWFSSHISDLVFLLHVLVPSFLLSKYRALPRFSPWTSPFSSLNNLLRHQLYTTDNHISQTGLSLPLQISIQLPVISTTWPTCACFLSKKFLWQT